LSLSPALKVRVVVDDIVRVYPQYRTRRAGS
jgi:hypothetical protein